MRWIYRKETRSGAGGLKGLGIEYILLLETLTAARQKLYRKDTSMLPKANPAEPAAPNHKKRWPCRSFLHGHLGRKLRLGSQKRSALGFTPLPQAVLHLACSVL